MMIFCQSGEISPNRVTLCLTHSLSSFEPTHSLYLNQGEGDRKSLTTILLKFEQTNVIRLPIVVATHISISLPLFYMLFLHKFLLGSLFIFELFFASYL